MIQETSRLSYAQVKEVGLGEKQRTVYEAIRRFCEGGFHPTDREIAEALLFSDPNMVRPRRFELVSMGLVEEAEKRVCSVSGKLAIAWRVPLDEPLFREDGDGLVQTRDVPLEEFKILLGLMRARGFMYIGGRRWKRK